MADRRRRIYISDAQPLAVRGLVSCLSQELGHEVLAGSSVPERVPGEAAEFHADLVIIGLLEDSDAVVDALGMLSRLLPKCRFVLLTDPKTGVDATTIVKAGVTAVLSRQASVPEVLATIRQALAGRALLSSDMAGLLMEELAVAVRRAEVGTGGDLTTRELEVLTLVADGLPNKQVAQRLHISENTVKNHMRSVHEKLNVRTRTEAVVTAAREGLLGLK